MLVCGNVTCNVQLCPYNFSFTYVTIRSYSYVLVVFYLQNHQKVIAGAVLRNLSRQISRCVLYSFNPKISCNYLIILIMHCLYNYMHTDAFSYLLNNKIARFLCTQLYLYSLLILNAMERSYFAIIQPCIHYR